MPRGRPPRFDEPTPVGRRRIRCFLAAVGEGLPTVAATLFPRIRISPSTSLAQLCDELADVPEGRRLEAWLDAHPPWAGLALARLDERVDMVDRLAFTAPRLSADTA